MRFPTHIVDNTRYIIDDTGVRMVSNSKSDLQGHSRSHGAI